MKSVLRPCRSFAIWLGKDAPKQSATSKSNSLVKDIKKSKEKILVTPPNDLSSSVHFEIPWEREKFIFMVPVEQKISHFVNDLKDEEGLKTRTVSILNKNSEKDNSSTLKDSNDGTISSLIKNEFSLIVGDKQFDVDVSKVKERVQRNNTTASWIENTLKTQTELKEKLNDKAKKRQNLIHLGGFGFLCAQLGAIIHLTYELGWDLMEPTTYLMGLAASAGFYGIFARSRLDFSLEEHIGKMEQKRRGKFYRSNGIEEAKFSQLSDYLQAIRTSNYVANVEIPLKDK